MDEGGDLFSLDEEKIWDCFEHRGFDFAYASQLWRQPVLEREDRRQDYGEIRIQAAGQIAGRRFIVVFTWRGRHRHIISARRAHQKEVLKWQKS